MKCQLLVVDDNKMMRHFLTQLLGKKHIVITSSSAEEALTQLQTNEQIDLVLTDYNLEGMSGLSLLKRIKASPQLSSIPVVILSGEGQSENRIKCLQANAADFVNKPFNPLELELKISRLLEDRTVANEAAN